MNAGVIEDNLTWVYVTGGLLTLVGGSLIGRLADRFGKLPVYRVVAAIAAVLDAGDHQSARCRYGWRWRSSAR